VIPAKTDADLIQIVDAALADATVRAGEHLVCRPGCFQCCIGAFAINALDAQRLLLGYEEIARRDPARFGRVQERVKAYVERTRSSFPGDPGSGILNSSPQAKDAFEEFANEEVCPVLDPDAGTCDLYEFRPMTCRIFGPPVRARSGDAGADDSEPEGLGVCELCFTSASPEEIAAAELVADPEDLEAEILERLVNESGGRGETTVAYALSTRLSLD
jgi:Fe-S-cluster containining protein